MKYLAAASLLFIPLIQPLSAQPGPDGQPNRDARVLVRSLGLDETQVQKLQDWLRSRQEVLQPLQQAQRENRRALGMAARGENADPAVVGELFLQSGEIQRAIGQVRQDARAGFADAVMLNQQQRDMLGFLASAFRYREAAEQARALDILQLQGDRAGAPPQAPNPPDPPQDPPNLSRGPGAAGTEITEKLDGIAADVAETKDTVTKIARANSIVIPE